MTGRGNPSTDWLLEPSLARVVDQWTQVGAAHAIVVINQVPRFRIDRQSLCQVQRRDQHWQWSVAQVLVVVLHVFQEIETTTTPHACQKKPHRRRPFQRRKVDKTVA